MADEHGQHVMTLAKALAGADGMIAGSGPVGELPATSQGGPTENRFAQASQPTSSRCRSDLALRLSCSIRR